MFNKRYTDFCERATCNLSNITVSSGIVFAEPLGEQRWKTSAIQKDFHCNFYVENPLHSFQTQPFLFILLALVTCRFDRSLSSSSQSSCSVGSGAIVRVVRAISQNEYFDSFFERSNSADAGGLADVNAMDGACPLRYKGFGLWRILIVKILITTFTSTPRAQGFFLQVTGKTGLFGRRKKVLCAARSGAEPKDELEERSVETKVSTCYSRHSGIFTWNVCPKIDHKTSDFVMQHEVGHSVPLSKT